MSAIRKTLIFVLLLVIALTALLFWPSSVPPRTLPTPNGYDALIAAAQQLTDPPDRTNANIDQLRTYVAANGNSLADIRKALKMEGMVPTEFAEGQNGKKAQSFEDLVPRYLKAAPIDATTGTNLLYKFEN